MLYRPCTVPLLSALYISALLIVSAVLSFCVYWNFALMYCTVTLYCTVLYCTVLYCNSLLYCLIYQPKKLLDFLIVSFDNNIFTFFLFQMPVLQITKVSCDGDAKRQWVLAFLSQTLMTLNICHKFYFSNPISLHLNDVDHYIIQTNISVKLINQKNSRFTPLGRKDIGIRQL